MKPDGDETPEGAAAGYGQQRQMEDPTMVGTLAAQCEMIWPIERPVLEALGLPGMERLLDLGCGTGEFARRAALAWPALSIHGLDLFEGHLEVARRNLPPGGVPNLALGRGDARDTGFEDGRFGAVTIRHFLQAIPDPEAVLQEARRVLRPGGLCYVLAEDYATLIFDSHAPISARLWDEASPPLLEKGTDLLQGRRTFRMLRALGFHDVRVDPVYVDTQNADRQTFARMLRFWRDGYDGFIADALGVPAQTIRERFDDLIATTLDEDRYACWLLFAVSGRRAPS